MYVRIEIDNDERRVIGDFTTITALESLRLRLRDPNIANCCKIAYNPSLVVVYFYIKLHLRGFPLLKVSIIFHYWSLCESNHI